MSHPYQHHNSGQPHQYYQPNQFPQYGDPPQYQQPFQPPQIEYVIPTRSQNSGYPLYPAPQQMPPRYQQSNQYQPPHYQRLSHQQLLQYQMASQQQERIQSQLANQHQPPQYQQSNQQLNANSTPESLYNFDLDTVNLMQHSPIMPSIPIQELSRILQDVQPNAPQQKSSDNNLQLQGRQGKAKLEVEEPDYAILLLVLADEYFDAASKLSRSSAKFHKLLATALGCLESTLQNFKISPLREAQVSLRYAQVLYDETENNDDAERVLTKAIDLCERNKFLDLKYGMQLLLSQILHRTRPKAALKDILAVIEDVQAYRHTAWEYALRFQYIQFLLSPTSTYDLNNAISQAGQISNMAHRNEDHAIFALAIVFEALLHLRSSNDEAVISAQRSLAKVRALQLNSEVSGNPQLMTMLEFIDLSCSLREFNLAQYEQKRKNLQQVLYQSLESSSWNDSTSVQIPINKRSLNGQQLQEGGLVIEKNSKFYLSFSWMAKEEAECLGYLLSAVSVSHKNASDGSKAEKFLETGLDLLRASSKEKDRIAREDTASNLSRTKILECQLRLELAFLQSARGRWSSAQNVLDSIEKSFSDEKRTFPSSITQTIQYLQGVVQQGTGNLTAALQIFQSPALSLTSPESIGYKSVSKSHNRSQHRDYHTVRNISILAAMNTSFIIRSPLHPQHNSLTALLTNLDPIVQHSENKNIQASYSFLKSILAENTILKAKQYLGSALHTAQQISNAQITALTLLLMQEKFFKGVVGDQAIKCAKAASHQVRRWNDPLWIYVAAKMEADCLELQGMREDAQKKRMEAESRLSHLPENIRNKIYP